MLIHSLERISSVLQSLVELHNRKYENLFSFLIERSDCRDALCKDLAERWEREWYCNNGRVYVLQNDALGISSKDVIIFGFSTALDSMLPGEFDAKSGCDECIFIYSSKVRSDLQNNLYYTRIYANDPCNDTYSQFYGCVYDYQLCGCFNHWFTKFIRPFDSKTGILFVDENGNVIRTTHDSKENLFLGLFFIGIHSSESKKIVIEFSKTVMVGRTVEFGDMRYFDICFNDNLEFYLLKMDDRKIYPESQSVLGFIKLLNKEYQI